MENQNVSAQLYYEQLPDQGSIEDAFQSQLDMSVHYKKPSVYNQFKKSYSDQTMPLMPDQESGPDYESGPESVTQETSNNSKSFFGSSGNNSKLFLFFLIIILVVYFYLKK
jgi:hypothetical protein